MTLPHLLLRLLLCIGLILNGSAYAMAGGSMQGEAHGKDNVAADHGMAMSDCHDAAPAQEPADQQPSHAGHDGASDCCQDNDRCHCDCQHHCAAAMPQAIVSGAQTANTRWIPCNSAGRATPLPQRHIRPPIAA